MNIAFISYEYPPDTAHGGIATYVGQAASMMAQRGHRVEVFAGSHSRSSTETEQEVVVHRIQEDDPGAFASRVGPAFAERHRTVRFDVLEGPEYQADAWDAVSFVPAIPLVVKLHTPSFMIFHMNDTRRLHRAYEVAAVLRRAAKRLLPLKEGRERLHALEADEVVAPCLSLGALVAREWGLEPAKVAHVPYPYTPSPKLLKIPAQTETGLITFFGRLEQRKGVLDLADAIPEVLKRKPETRFRFVGKPLSSPTPGVDMRQHLQQKLRAYGRSVEFMSPVPLDQVPVLLGASDICVFPSLWENFPNVCLESMAAARGLVASRAGGMAEMLEGGKYGELISPHRPSQIADALCRLLDDPQRRIRLGETARERVLSEYNTDRVGALQEASYARAIERRREAGPRRRRTCSVVSKTSAGGFPLEDVTL